jgi:hypothetical protein
LPGNRYAGRNQHYILAIWDVTRNNRHYFSVCRLKGHNIWSVNEDFVMKKFLSALCATALTASFAITGALPANSAPIYVPKAPTVEHSDVVKVQDFRWKRRGGRDGPRFNRRNFNNNWDGPRRIDRRYGWYNGHRGYRYKRRGYRYHDGFWFPAGAFITGAIIGGAIANNNSYYRGGGSSHVEWCYDRYRSYRASDNTFQPYNGPRRQCYSPYG